MGRRPPRAVRAAQSRPTHRPEIDGLSASTLWALNRLDREDLRADAVRDALVYWWRLSRASRDVLIGTFDNVPYESWPRQMDDARSTLERAVAALPRRAARELRVIVEGIDAVVLARTHPVYGDWGRGPNWWQCRSVVR